MATMLSVFVFVATKAIVKSFGSTGHGIMRNCVEDFNFKLVFDICNVFGTVE